MRAIQITRFDGPEVLTVADVPDPEPRTGQIPLTVRAAGVNYADTQQIEDSYLAPATLPLVPGAAVVGTAPDGRRVVALIGTSRAVVGFWLSHMVRRGEPFTAALRDLLELASAGSIRAVGGGAYPLEDARRAHEDLLARRTVGKLVLHP